MSDLRDQGVTDTNRPVSPMPKVAEGNSTHAEDQNARKSSVDRTLSLNKAGSVFGEGTSSTLLGQVNLNGPEGALTSGNPQDAHPHEIVE